MDGSEASRAGRPGADGPPERWPASPAWSGTTRLWVLTFILGVCLFVWWQVRQFTGIVVLAFLLTYILHPVIGRLRRHTGLGRRSATGVVYASLAVLTVVGLLALGRGVVSGLATVNPRQVWDETVLELFAVLPERVWVLGNAIELRGAYQQLQAELGNLGNLTMQAFRTDSMSWLLGAASTFAFAVFGFLVIFFTAFYLSLDGSGIVAYFERKAPEPYRPVYRALLAEIDGVWQDFFRGQLILALVIGAATTAGLLVLGVRYAVTLGVIAGVLEVVPRLGPVLSTVPAVAVALVQPSSTFPDLPTPVFVLLVIGLYVLIQAAENNILVPRILGGSVNLPPAVVLVGALAGAALGGVVGILLAAPILGSVRVIGSWLYAQLVRPDGPAPPAPERLRWPAAPAEEADPSQVAPARR
jgi:predicted PurR-regulated permease PerM